MMRSMFVLLVFIGMVYGPNWLKIAILGILAIAVVFVLASHRNI